MYTILTKDASVSLNSRTRNPTISGWINKVRSATQSADLLVCVCNENSINRVEETANKIIKWRDVIVSLHFQLHYPVCLKHSIFNQLMFSKKYCVRWIIHTERSTNTV